MMRRRSILLAGGAVAVLAAGGIWLAYDGTAADGIVFTEDGLAIRGYDPVAYFTQGKPILGDPAFEVEHEGVRWRFANAEHARAFEAEPARYMPRFGGYCAWAVAAKGEAYPVDPMAWKIVDGALYLNFNADIQAAWEKDIPGFIREGRENWPQVRQRLAAQAAT